MKRRITIIALTLLWVAGCSTNELDESAVNNPEQAAPVSRAGNDEPHFLDQFQGLPVTIHSPQGIGSVDKDLYLTRTGDYTAINIKMLPKRTGDMAYTQRWYIEESTDNDNQFRLKSAFADLPGWMIQTLIDNYSGPGYTPYTQYLMYAASANQVPFGFRIAHKMEPAPQSYFEVLSDTFNPVNKNIKVLYDNKTYYCRVEYGEGGEPYFNENDSSNFRNFRITSVENFYLQSMEYSLESGDGAVPIPSFIDEIVVNNQTSIPQNMTATFSNKVTEQTTFSSSNGGSASQSLSISTGVTVKTPWVNVDTSLSFNTSSGSNWNYTEGTTQSQEDSRQYSFTLTVPANASYRATISIARYEAQATYKATFRGQTTGFLVEETGKWNGINAGLITYDIIDNSTNQVVTHIMGTPDEPVDVMQAKGKVLDYRKNIRTEYIK